MLRLPHALDAALAVSTSVARAAEFLFRRADASGDVYPDDPDRGVVAGPDPDRVLFLAEPGQVSLGVRTHELSLPAFFSRHVAARTHRGIAWSISAVPGSRLRNAPRIVARQEDELQHVDAVVILVGITDVLRVTGVAAWERHLRATLDAVAERVPRDTPILISDIPPLDNAGSLSRPARVAAGIHGRALDRHTRAVLADHPTAQAIGFPEELTRSLWLPESVEQRYRDTYRIWGAHLAEAFLRDAALRDAALRDLE
jgi:hypothetical protein